MSGRRYPDGMKNRVIAVALLALTLTTLPVGAARFDVPRPVPGPAAPPRPTRAECGRLALKVALAKARAEQRELRSGASAAELFAASELIKAEYTRREGCVVTVSLPLERLQKLSER